MKELPAAEIYPDDGRTDKGGFVNGKWGRHKKGEHLNDDSRKVLLNNFAELKRLGDKWYTKVAVSVNSDSHASPYPLTNSGDCPKITT